MSDDLATLLLGKIEKLGLDLAQVRQVEGELKQKIDRLLALSGAETDDEFADIEPERVYSVAELAALPGRECSTTAIYAAMDRKRLRETLGAGTRGAKGKDFIAFLSERKGSRRGARSAKAGK